MTAQVDTNIAKTLAGLAEAVKSGAMDYDQLMLDLKSLVRNETGKPGSVTEFLAGLSKSGKSGIQKALNRLLKYAPEQFQVEMAEAGGPVVGAAVEAATPKVPTGVEALSPKKDLDVPGLLSAEEKVAGIAKERAAGGVTVGAGKSSEMPTGVKRIWTKLTGDKQPGAAELKQFSNEFRASMKRFLKPEYANLYSGGNAQTMSAERGLLQVLRESVRFLGPAGGKARPSGSFGAKLKEVWDISLLQTMRAQGIPLNEKTLTPTGMAMLESVGERLQAAPKGARELLTAEKTFAGMRPGATKMPINKYGMPSVAGLSNLAKGAVAGPLMGLGAGLLASSAVSSVVEGRKNLASAKREFQASMPTVEGLLSDIETEELLARRAARSMAPQMLQHNRPDLASRLEGLLSGADEAAPTGMAAVPGMMRFGGGSGGSPQNGSELAGLLAQEQL